MAGSGFRGFLFCVCWMGVDSGVSSYEAYGRLLRQVNVSMVPNIFGRTRTRQTSTSFSTSITQAKPPKIHSIAPNSSPTSKHHRLHQYLDNPPFPQHQTNPPQNPSVYPSSRTRTHSTASETNQYRLSVVKKSDKKKAIAGHGVGIVHFQSRLSSTTDRSTISTYQKPFILPESRDRR